MKLTREYENYSDYIAFQKIKTLDPTKRQKWLNEEWQSKINGFKDQFKRLSGFLTPEKKCLCLGARVGQEVVALQELGLEDSIGIDIVPHEPYVIEGDIHDLKFDDNTFDFIFTNILDHSIDPQKMINEAERVLKVGGVMLVQIQLGISQDEYTEFIPNNIYLDIVSLFNNSYCMHTGFVNDDRSPNIFGMNYELCFQKDQKLTELNDKYGNIQTIKVPKNYEKIWNDINHKIQNQKLDRAGITETEQRREILSGLIRRAYYLSRIAEVHDVKNIAEVGTAEGWQFYSFCEYADSVDGSVFSCDPRDVRNTDYIKKFEHEKQIGNFVNATSAEMSLLAKDVDMFYIDGLHDKGSVLTDIENLTKSQSEKQVPVWVLDDFDTRFGCFGDIAKACSASRKFKVWKVGKTASGFDSHQAMFVSRVK
mgnify:CR=1 FL=1